MHRHQHSLPCSLAAAAHLLLWLLSKFPNTALCHKSWTHSILNVLNLSLVFHRLNWVPVICIMSVGPCRLLRSSVASHLQGFGHIAGPSQRPA